MYSPMKVAPKASKVKTTLSNTFGISGELRV